ncbi:hypothetical protein AAC387_Pa05g3626 [Persea americana]
MTIRCDVCNREVASVFCSADEAALCDGCDGRVHHANKLASKHPRFSLLHPSYKQSPLCDICKERRAFVFCREDRAILCGECDLSIHTSNRLTQKHSRFLLTGITLSSSPFSSVSSTSAAAAADSSKQVMEKKKKKTVFDEMGSSLPEEKVEDLCMSSISEYLIKTLPGWHVEELLGSSPPADGLCERDDLMTFSKKDQLDGHLSIVSEDFGTWGPQVPQIQGPCFPPGVLGSQNGVGLKDFKEAGNVRVVLRSSDDGFTVPQMSPPYKRSRPLWQ